MYLERRTNRCCQRLRQKRKQLHRQTPRRSSCRCRDARCSPASRRMGGSSSLTEDSMTWVTVSGWSRWYASSAAALRAKKERGERESATNAAIRWRTASAERLAASVGWFDCCVVHVVIRMDSSAGSSLVRLLPTFAAANAVAAPPDSSSVRRFLGKGPLGGSVETRRTCRYKTHLRGLLILGPCPVDRCGQQLVGEQQLGEAVGATPAPMQRYGDIPRAQNSWQHPSVRLIVASCAL
jgi:hypothetical protein